MLRRYRGAVLTLAVLFGLLGRAIWTMIQMWTSVEGDMGTHEWIALVLGVFFSCLVVGFGLMGLMFFSSREGYDEPPTYIREDENHDEDEGKGSSARANFCDLASTSQSIESGASELLLFRRAVRHVCF